MSRPKIPRFVKPGEVITARMWNDLVALVKRCDLSVGPGSGLAMLQTPEGTALRLANPNAASGFLCIANGNIPARSGSTGGVGSVYSVTTTPTYTSGSLTGATFATDSTAYDVINPSSNNMTDSHGIDSGQ